MTLVRVPIPAIVGSIRYARSSGALGMISRIARDQIAAGNISSPYLGCALAEPILMREGRRLRTALDGKDIPLIRAHRSIAEDLGDEVLAKYSTIALDIARSEARRFQVIFHELKAITCIEMSIELYSYQARRTEELADSGFLETLRLVSALHHSNLGFDLYNSGNVSDIDWAHSILEGLFRDSLSAILFPESLIFDIEKAKFPSPVEADLKSFVEKHNSQVGHYMSEGKVIKNFDLSRNIARFDHLLSARPDVQVSYVLAEYSIPIEWDLFDLSSVVDNLVKNAIEAMPGGGKLTVRTWAEESLACFSIRDTGTGIPPEKQEKIFQTFFTEGKFGGKGIGLSYVREIVGSYGGTIKVESEVGKGTTFTVKIPMSS